MSSIISADVLGKLRQEVAGLRKSPVYYQNVEARDEVLARYQPVFSLEHAGHITAEEFRGFLVLENNRHWTGLHRQGPRICSNMRNLRKALAILLDAPEPLAERLDGATELVSGMGKNIATAILTVAYPDTCGVWNNRSEYNMKRLGIWPTFGKGESFGNRYMKINQVLLELRDSLDINLWMLDTLWWYLDRPVEPPFEPDGDNPPICPDEPLSKDQRFGLERHLHEFMRDNWSHLALAKEWDLYKEPGDDEAGYEYTCSIGRIDLLAKHKRKPQWLVIELKRNQTSDQTVGQLLRYVGWVKANLAAKGDSVRGMIICREADESLHLALSVVPDAEIQFYEVEFRLRKP